LARLSGVSEVTLGSEFDGRRYEELATSLGPLARTLPVQISVAPAKSFGELVRETEIATSEARNWQESFTWNQITDAENPILPLTFSFSELATPESAAGVGFTLERVEVVSERFKLKLNVARRGPALALEFHYDASRFERSAVERIAGYYQNLLSAALANPAIPVSRLPLLSESEREQLMVEWTQTA